MAVGLKVRPDISGPVVARNIPPTKMPIEKQGFELRLGLGQVIVIWSVLAGLMVAVFMFGLHAGREQGLETALSGQNVQTVRMPIAMDVARAEESVSLAFDPAKKELVDSAVLPGAVDAQAPVVKDEPQFDFAAAVEQAKQAAQNDEKLKAAADELQANSPVEIKPLVEKAKEVLAADVAAPAPVAPAPVAKPDEEFARSEISAASDKSVVESLDRRLKAAVVEPPVQVKPEIKTAVTAPMVKVPPVEQPAVVKPPVVAAKAPAPVVAPSSGVRSGWYVQVAAARSRAEANGIQSGLRAKGVASGIQEADVNGMRYYRVLAGPFAKDRARAEQGRIAGYKLTSGAPFVKFIP